jgi:signal transduction histidine kinase/CheY-like chemotaxis protein
MQFGLKNRLKLISLLPIIILFSMTSYYFYNSFFEYKAAKELQNRLDQNKILNDLIRNLARERGMSAMYLGNQTENILKSLNEQRKIVDEKIALYIKHLQQEKVSSEIPLMLSKIKSVRALVNSNEIEFSEMFIDIYSKAQEKLIQQLNYTAKDIDDKAINELYSLYISMVHAKEASGIERGYLSYIISRSRVLSPDDLNRWISIISKADAITYEKIQNKELVKKIDAIFKTKESKELFADINSERTAIITAAKSGKYDIDSGIWFTMLSEKINLISKAEILLLNTIDNKAYKIQNSSLQVLIITFTIWIIAIILAILGYLLANEITKNIKKLENVLKKVAHDYNTQDRKINLHTSQGTNLAYGLLEEIIEQTKKDKVSAQEANEAKSMFLANMSHEIRTPLNGIVGFTELLKDSGLGEEQKEFVDIIEKSSENLLEIINNILDLSKIESNKLEIENIAFDPIVEFENAVEVYAVRASEKNIDLGCFIDPWLESPLKGDPTKLKEVLINLLSNAIKFTNNNGFININIRKIKSDEADKTRVKFEIQDSGIGIADEQKSRIFEAFSQADTSITRKYGGTGLGLTISSSFIDLMSGKLDLESKPEKGTTFFFTLDFEEIETLSKSFQDRFNDLNAIILESSHKTKNQDNYLKEYLDYFGVKYAVVKEMHKIKSLLENKNYDLLFVDYDYIDKETLAKLATLAPKLVVLTKSNIMKQIDTFGFNIFKILYEPLHSSKIKQILLNYISLNKFTQDSKKHSGKNFALSKPKFAANVLVAEDNIINQKLIKRTLEDLGLNVTVANNGLEAFQKRKDEDFDIIFMDIQMPVLDGIEATTEILKWEEDYKQAHVPIVALTANALKGDREKFLSAGLDEYTTKPLIRLEIVSILNKFLADHIVRDTNLPNKSVKLHIKPKYKADVLIAKKSDFETKLYTKIVETIEGITYEVASSPVNFKELIENYSYKIVLFDKEYDTLDIETISSVIKKRSASNGLDSIIVLIDESNQKETLTYKKYVDEVIKNVINRDLLKSLFIKYI